MGFNDYNYLYEESAEELGTTGFCDLVAELLQKSFPEAELYRLSNGTENSFAHVFLVIGSLMLDIKGFRSLEEYKKEEAERNHYAEPVKWPQVRAAFRYNRDRHEIDIARSRFVDYIAENPDKFTLNLGE